MSGGGICSRHDSSPTVTNCILWNNSAQSDYGPQISVFDDYLNISFSNVEGGEAAVYVDQDSTLQWGLGNIDADPLFVVGGDYHLSPGSPCIDAGHAGSIYDDDCFPPSMGTTRNDMGAYGGPLGCDWISCPDADGDGFHDQACGGTDCHDDNPDKHPDAVENCRNGIDDDCDGLVDLDDPWCQSCPSVEGTWLLNDDWEKSTDVATFHPDGTVEFSSSFYTGTWDQVGCCVKWVVGIMPAFPTYSGVMDLGGDAMEGEMVSSFGTAGTWTAARIPPDFSLYLDLSLSYDAGTISLDFTIGSIESSVWSTYLILTYPSISIIPIWTISLPAIYPPLDVPISFPVPSMGWVGVYTTVALESGEEAYDLEWIDTGW